ncbi:MAG: amino acid permease [Deltaproteobacteria bacterium]|nr:amino acid permease [Deltaproteobacteria bacterium]
MGGVPAGGFPLDSNSANGIQPFWIVFAVFFPAVTGIEAGLAMSGDLKNPARSLPIGTILAVLFGFIVYISIPIFLLSIVPKDALIENRFIFQTVAKYKGIILLGIWGATLSSALGSLLGAPRTLQALAKDKIVPSFLGNGYGSQNNPRIATAVSFLIALIALIFGNLNSIAPVLSMFFLTTYGTLNLVAGLEGIISNPSWRPSFRTPWSISLLGALLCLIAMFMINAGATFIAIASVTALYYFIAKMKFNDRWLDIRRSIHMALARFSIYRLADKGEDARSWRPNILVLSGSPTKRFYLIELADAFSHGKGFLTVASILQQENIAPEKIDEMERSIREYLKEKDIPALVEIVVADNFSAGVENLVKTYGIGPLIPNTIVMGETEDDGKYIEFAKIVRLIYKSQRNLVIIRESKISKPVETPHKQISCWWGGKRNNGGLMLALAYMLQTSPEWRGAKLSIKTIVKDEEEQEPTRKEIGEFLKEARVIADADVVVHPYKLSPIPTTIKEASMDADLTIIGMKPPDEGESDEDYATYYKKLMQQTEGFPSLAILLAAENIKFQDIFA